MSNQIHPTAIIHPNVILGEGNNWLTVIGEAEPYLKRSGNKDAAVMVRCVCGKEFKIRKYLLKKQKSCGCIKPQVSTDFNTTHGLSKHPLYRRWQGIKKRCYDKKSQTYYKYGGKGITVCDEWLSDFMPFYNWAIANGFRKDLEIDRRDNSKGYSPDNCRWVSPTQNVRNRGITVKVTYNGITRPLIEWCEILNLEYRNIIQVIKRRHTSVDVAFKRAIKSRIYKKNNIHKNAIVYDNVEIGIGNTIGAFCIIGAPAEHKDYYHKEPGKVIIGNNNILTGLITVDAGTEHPTIIGNNCFIMKSAHIGHDAQILDGVTISCGAKVGGHAIIGCHSNLGLNSVIHQKQQIAEGVMIGMGAVVTKKLATEPYKTYAGNPAKLIGENDKHPNYGEYTVNMKEFI